MWRDDSRHFFILNLGFREFYEQKNQCICE